MSGAQQHAGRVWVLNLDAEYELEVGTRYAPTRRMLELVAAQRRRLLGALLGPADVVVTETAPQAAGSENLGGRQGCAWSPTPRALRLLRTVGARVPDAPDFTVLRRVNARSFAREVRAPLAGASFEKQRAEELETALSLISRPADAGWLVRRAYGAAGRGRRRIAAGRPSDDERLWLAASLRKGALVIEPWVRVTRELTRSGWVGRDGRVELLPPCFQATSASGAWEHSAATGRGELSPAHERGLEQAAGQAGRALAAAGYFGPFGIDAFLHRPPGGPAASGAREVLNPLSEINARFTMDWNVARSRHVKGVLDPA